LQATALGWDARVGETVADGSRVFNFRSVVGGEGSYGGGAVSDGAAGGNNPFDVILADPLARVERDLGSVSSKQDRLEKRLEELIAMQAPHGTALGGRTAMPPPEEASDKREVPLPGNSSTMQASSVASRLAALSPRLTALSSHAVEAPLPNSAKPVKAHPTGRVAPMPVENGCAAITGTSITELPLRNQTRTSMEDTFDK
jgi:hypothetical protein